jgi:hypothetical protein
MHTAHSRRAAHAHTRGSSAAAHSHASADALAGRITCHEVRGDVPLRLAPPASPAGGLSLHGLAQ